MRLNSLNRIRDFAQRHRALIEEILLNTNATTNVETEEKYALFVTKAEDIIRDTANVIEKVVQ